MLGHLLMKKNISLTPLVGMFLLMLNAYSLDVWINKNFYQVTPSEFSGALHGLLPVYLARLSLAGLLLIWLWLIYKKDQNVRVFTIIYVLIGFGFPFYNFLGVVLTPRLPLLMPLIIFPNSVSFFVSMIVGMVGLHRLFVRKVVL